MSSSKEIRLTTGSVLEAIYELQKQGIEKIREKQVLAKLAQQFGIPWLDGPVSSMPNWTVPGATQLGTQLTNQLRDYTYLFAISKLDIWKTLIFTEKRARKKGLGLLYDWLDPEENIPTSIGSFSAREWLLREKNRIEQDPARVAEIVRDGKRLTLFVNKI